MEVSFMEEKKRRKSYNIILVCILLVIFCISSSYLIYVEYTKYQEQQAFEELQIKKQALEEQRRKAEQRKLEEQRRLEEQKRQEQEKQEMLKQEQAEEEIVEELVILSEYEKLYEENNDLYGWLRIEETVIDYPVMHTPENPNYYIHKNWEKEESNAGTPFVDTRTILGETENTIIYAHNMKNRTMFGSLREYKDKTYYEKHKYIEFDTIYEKSKYEIIAVSKAVVYYEKEPPKGEYLFYEHTELGSKGEFDAYVKTAKENAYFETGVTAEYGDKLITLCTCDYWTDNARLLVIAKKIE